MTDIPRAMLRIRLVALCRHLDKHPEDLRGWRRLRKTYAAYAALNSNPELN